MDHIDPRTNCCRAYTISDFSALYGVSLRTLRFYEERELLRPQRAGNMRLYDETDRIRLEIIIKAKRFGFSLAEIWELLERRLDRRCDLPLSKGEIEHQLDKLSSVRVRVVDAIEELQKVLASQTSDRPQEQSGVL